MGEKQNAWRMTSMHDVVVLSFLSFFFVLPVCVFMVMTGAIRWKHAEVVVQEEEEEVAGCRRGDGQMLMGREREEGGRWLPKKCCKCCRFKMARKFA